MKYIKSEPETGKRAISYKMKQFKALNYTDFLSVFHTAIHKCIILNIR